MPYQRRCFGNETLEAESEQNGYGDANEQFLFHRDGLENNAQVFRVI